MRPISTFTTATLSNQPFYSVVREHCPPPEVWRFNQVLCLASDKEKQPQFYYSPAESLWRGSRDSGKDRCRSRCPLCNLNLDYSTEEWIDTYNQALPNGGTSLWQLSPPHNLLNVGMAGYAKDDNNIQRLTNA